MNISKLIFLAPLALLAGCGSQQSTVISKTFENSDGSRSLTVHYPEIHDYEMDRGLGSVEHAVVNFTDPTEIPEIESASVATCTATYGPYGVDENRTYYVRCRASLRNHSWSWDFHDDFMFTETIELLHIGRPG